jgi:hypothetical protein
MMKATKMFLFPKFYRKMTKYSYDDEARRAKAEKASINSFKLFYYISAVFFGYHFVLKHLDYLPSVMFGSGDIINLYKDYPLKQNPDGFKIYYHIELGWHALSCITHLGSIPRNDFMEMSLHHVLAVLLIFCSLMAGFSNCGVLVLFLHNCSDIFAALVRLLADAFNLYLAFAAYLGLLASWFYTRIFVFNVYVIWYTEFDFRAKHFRG